MQFQIHRTLASSEQQALELAQTIRHHSYKIVYSRVEHISYNVWLVYVHVQNY